ncbi:hypothetical protein ACWKWK_00685 [Pseudoxanthomonas beigongshangi]
MPRTLPWVLVCACVFATAGAWWWAQSARDVANAATVSAAAIVDEAPVATARPANRIEEPSRSALVFDSRREFETTPDLFVYAQQLALQARAGDADAWWMLSRVHDYCAGFASNPAGYARDTRAIAALDVSSAASMAAARERVSARCARFMPEDGLSSRSVHQARLQAAKGGSLAAEAALLADGEPLSEAPGYRGELVARVSASGDPQAFLALSRAMGLTASGVETELGDVSGTWLSEVAWQIAACRLGLDCRPQGNLMTTYCAHGGICSRDPSLDFPAFVLDAGVPRQGVENLNEMVDSLLSRRRAIR